MWLNSASGKKWYASSSPEYKMSHVLGWDRMMPRGSWNHNIVETWDDMRGFLGPPVTTWRELHGEHAQPLVLDFVWQEISLYCGSLRFGIVSYSSWFTLIHHILSLLPFASGFIYLPCHTPPFSALLFIVMNNGHHQKQAKLTPLPFKGLLIVAKNTYFVFQIPSRELS